MSFYCNSCAYLPLVCALQIVSKLKEEIGAMEKEHSELQQHITRTDWWCENLGNWRATITTAEVKGNYKPECKNK